MTVIIMNTSNATGSSCVCVHLSVCLFVCLSVCLYLDNSALRAEVYEQRQQTNMQSRHDFCRLPMTIEPHYVSPWQQREDVPQTLEARTPAVEYHLHAQLSSTVLRYFQRLVLSTSRALFTASLTSQRTCWLHADKNRNH